MAKIGQSLELMHKQMDRLAAGLGNSNNFLSVSLISPPQGAEKGYLRLMNGTFMVLGEEMPNLGSTMVKSPGVGDPVDKSTKPLINFTASLFHVVTRRTIDCGVTPGEISSLVPSVCQSVEQLRSSHGKTLILLGVTAIYETERSEAFSSQFINRQFFAELRKRIPQHIGVLPQDEGEARDLTCTIIRA